jgi:hypothetical protein
MRNDIRWIMTVLGLWFMAYTASVEANPLPMSYPELKLSEEGCGVDVTWHKLLDMGFDQMPDVLERTLMDGGTGETVSVKISWTFLKSYSEPYGYSDIESLSWEIDVFHDEIREAGTWRYKFFAQGENVWGEYDIVVSEASLCTGPEEDAGKIDAGEDMMSKDALITKEDTGAVENDTEQTGSDTQAGADAIVKDTTDAKDSSNPKEQTSSSCTMSDEASPTSALLLFFLIGLVVMLRANNKLR